MPHPLPWYIAGPLIGLIVPALLLIGNKPFGISSNFRHICAAAAPCGIEFFSHDWKRAGLWNLTFLAGVCVGATIAVWLAPPTPIQRARSSAGWSDRLRTQPGARNQLYLEFTWTAA